LSGLFAILEQWAWVFTFKRLYPWRSEGVLMVCRFRNICTVYCLPFQAANIFMDKGGALKIGDFGHVTHGQQNAGSGLSSQFEVCLLMSLFYIISKNI